MCKKEREGGRKRVCVRGGGWRGGGAWGVSVPGGGSGGGGVVGSGRAVGRTARLDRVALPRRSGNLEAMRRVFMASLQGLSVRMRYLSVHGAKDSWRVVRPHAWGHDGNRWHVRAWCETSGELRDCTVGRIVDAEWPQASEEAMTVDMEGEVMGEWKAWEARGAEGAQGGGGSDEDGGGGSGGGSMGVRWAVDRVGGDGKNRGGPTRQRLVPVPAGTRPRAAAPPAAATRARASRTVSRSR